ncbi:MAG: phosphoglucomutase [Desulfobulbaceae bacterium]|nr:phosphoglucomutase [Desulfobulbaceae bacterium]
MTTPKNITAKTSPFIVANDHQRSNYFEAIKVLVAEREKAQASERPQWQQAIDEIYALVADEIRTNSGEPSQAISFGTSGWRGILGKDLFLRSVAVVTAAILTLYKEADADASLHASLGVDSFAEMQERGCVLGFDNRFGGPMLALAVANVLAANQVKIFYAGEATTGALSASLLINRAAFSINLTPSHNPMEYAGFKYNAADAGPAAEILTTSITRTAQDYCKRQAVPFLAKGLNLQEPLGNLPNVVQENALASWQQLIRRGASQHGIDYDALLADFAASDQMLVCVDAVHGASRTVIADLLGNPGPEHLLLLRDNADPTFGGIAPEPSAANMRLALDTLAKKQAPLKLGAVIDPDGDRIRFTDGQTEISMNQFGAMAFHFLHEIKGKRGMVAKTVASSNLANAVAAKLGEEVFEPKVGFKEFKPVIDRALVCFEESDGISIIGHTPEKDAFIGLILALDMMRTLNKPLGAYLEEIEDRFGHYYPAKDGVTVSQQGATLLATLDGLNRYDVGTTIRVGDKEKKIKQVIAIDGRKMILEDDSWIMIRPSGTEPKVRFYVEARDPKDCALLVDAAKSLLAETGLLP